VEWCGETPADSNAPATLNLTIGWGEPHKTHSKQSFFSANEFITPASLYLGHLRDRLGGEM
jgi:hypothetical protein